MTDREMLELAAKAAGLEFNDKRSPTGSIALYCPMEGWWDPLTNDGDALRLAVKIWICLDIEGEAICASVYKARPENCIHVHEREFNDMAAATRRAVTRAAAEIGKSMEDTNA